MKYSEETYQVVWQKTYEHHTTLGITQNNKLFHATTLSVAFTLQHSNSAWTTGANDFLFLRVDAATGNTVQNTFGLGANTGSNEESQNLFYSEADQTVFICYFSWQNLRIAKISLTPSTTVQWAKTTDIDIDNTIYFESRYFFFDQNTGKVYVTSNYQTLYMFVCIF